MPNVARLSTLGDVSGNSLMFRNKIINGNFDIWQRGTSQTSSGYGSDDRWSNEQTGSTKTHTRETFTLGQIDVPNNPKYYSRTVVISSSGSGNYCFKAQKIESVLTFSGSTATLSFWAKADASKNIAIEFVQVFGTGGSPSSSVTGIGVTTCALTTSWKKFIVTVNIPSISGKTLGTAGDDFISFNFWFEAGSSFNSRTNNLGQQSGTFDISQVQFESGSAATPFEQRSISLELSLCQRYYEVLFSTSSNYALDFTYVNAGDYRAMWCFKAEKRARPTAALTSGSSWTAATPTFYYSKSHLGFFNTNGGAINGGSADKAVLYAESEL